MVTIVFNATPPCSLHHQGQRPLTRFPRKDFQQEVIVPTASVSLADDAVFAGMLLEQRERESIEPRKILPRGLVANPRFVFTERHVQTPVTTVFDAQCLRSACAN